MDFSTMLTPLDFLQDSASTWEALSTELKAWEPALELWFSRQVPRIYEPDGTLYAICLTTTQLTTDRRHVDVGRGDLIVVPQALAIDVESPIDLICIKHEGMVPYHFRERFIQVWGFERITATEAHDPRRTRLHRLQYQIVDLNKGQVEIGSRGLDLRLVIWLSGEFEVHLSGEHEVKTMNESSLLLVGTEYEFHIEGQGRYGLLTIASELMHEHRLERLYEIEAPSPDYAPPNQPMDSSAFSNESGSPRGV